MRVPCWSLCVVAALFQSASCASYLAEMLSKSVLQPASAPSLANILPVSTFRDFNRPSAAASAASLDEHMQLLDGINNDTPHGHLDELDSQLDQPQEEEDASSYNGSDFLDDKDSRLVMSKFVHTTVNIYKDKELRKEITGILKSVNGLFEREEPYEIVQNLTNAMISSLLVPENLATLSKLIDLGTLVVLDQEFHKVIDREMKLVDRFLEDKLSKLTFVMVGETMSTVTENGEIYKMCGDVLDQLNKFLTAKNLKVLADFSSSLSETLTYTVPKIVTIV